jgi:hypothetical protein
MAGAMVVIWIFGGSFVAMLVLNAITSGGASAMGSGTPGTPSR